jgi:hypothetical protein
VVLGFAFPGALVQWSVPSARLDRWAGAPGHVGDAVAGG